MGGIWPEVSSCRKLKGMRCPPRLHLLACYTCHNNEIKPGSKVWGSGSPLGTILSPHNWTFGNVLRHEDIFYLN